MIVFYSRLIEVVMVLILGGAVISDKKIDTDKKTSFIIWLVIIMLFDFFLISRDIFKFSTNPEMLNLVSRTIRYTGIFLWFFRLQAGAA